MSEQEYKSTDERGYITTTTLNRFAFGLVNVTITRRDPDGKLVSAPRSSIVPWDWLREAAENI